MIQGGDPAGDGSGGPGYTIPAEINHLHTKGALAWARTGDEVNPERNSSGSQFYVTLDETPFLDGGYSVFGQVIEGMDVAEKIAVGDKIQKIEISKATASLMPTPEPTAAPNPPVASRRPAAGQAQAGRAQRCLQHSAGHDHRRDKILPGHHRDRQGQYRGRAGSRRPRR